MFRSMWCNIRKWRNNYRVYIAFLAVAVFTYIRSDSIKNYAALKGRKRTISSTLTNICRSHG